MKTNRSKQGFTMMEMVGTVAILAILAAIAFVAVIRYQRSLQRLEMDETAKEIYMAAQNHLTMADTQDLLATTSRNKGTREDGTVYYFMHTDDVQSDDPNNPGNSGSVLNLMLPFAAVDETVRLGGSYVISYDAEAGQVLDVYYTDKFKFEASDYTDEKGLKDYKDREGVDNKTKRERYKLNGRDDAIGWYGSSAEGASKNPIKYQAPHIDVINAERLYVNITDYKHPDSEAERAKHLQLFVKGERSGATMVFDLTHKAGDAYTQGTPAGSSSLGYDQFYEGPKSDTHDAYSYRVVLDDITRRGYSFMGITQKTGPTNYQVNGTFIPGENVQVYAQISSEIKQVRITQSGTQTTNSLFATYSAGDKHVDIANIRHLENLDASISGFDARRADLTVTKAEQRAPLVWSGAARGFVEKIKADTGSTSVVVYPSSGGTELTSDGNYQPVQVVKGFTYDGHALSITGVRTNSATPSGLFGTLPADSTVTNLELMDFSIASSGGSAGALAGEAHGATITNVLAHHTPTATASNYQVRGTTAGGLVGSMSGGKIERSAAALLVQASAGDAGGLIGTATDVATITGCYSGGHTAGTATNRNEPVLYDSTNYNVTASGVAGGMIGSASGCTIAACYSTCSVSGATAGGFVGTATGGSIANAYATGLVGGSGARGAFAASASGLTNCSYFSIINRQTDEDGNVIQLNGLAGDAPDGDGVYAFDTSVDVYNGASGPAVHSQTADALPYDKQLASRFTQGGAAEYPYKSIDELLGVTPASIGVMKRDHYGDWPAPETLVVNVG